MERIQKIKERQIRKQNLSEMKEKIKRIKRREKITEREIETHIF